LQTPAVTRFVTSATDRIQEAAPARAAQLEKNSEFLRTVHLRRRVQSFVNGIPARLSGGSAKEALESAATRGVAFVAGLILTIFFILYGPRLFTSGLDQIRDPDRRGLIERVIVRGTRRSTAPRRVLEGWRGDDDRPSLRQISSAPQGQADVCGTECDSVAPAVCRRLDHRRWQAASAPPAAQPPP